MVGAALALSASGASAATADACKLVSAAEVGAALGGAVTVSQAISGATGSTCTWTQARGLAVTLTIKPAKAFETGKKVMSPKPVAGIGDDGYQSTFGPTYTALSVRKGDRALDVAVRGGKDLGAAQAQEKAIARTAIGRL
jgi:hypothetical protein